MPAAAPGLARSRAWADQDPAGHGRPECLVVVAAAIIRAGHLLVVSKEDAPDVFYLPRGKPEAGESAEQTLTRELGEELGAMPAGLRPLGQVEEVAALERVPMRMTVFTARISPDPRPAAELAALGWTNGLDGCARLLAPAVSGHVIPLLRSGGLLPG
jgi:8-oxo-dGTP diphosphatase